MVGNKRTAKLLDPEFRREIANQLAKVQRVGCEIARKIGRMKSIGGGHPLVATFDDFQILYFTQFNQPKSWRTIDWEDERFRTSLCGLTIGDSRTSCLSVVWMKDWRHYFFIRDPSDDDWDRKLRRSWRSAWSAA